MIKLRKLVCVFVLCALFFSLSGCNTSGSSLNDTQKITDKKYSIEELQEDFIQFQKAIESGHPKLYDKDNELSKLFAKQYALLRDNMGEMEYYRILSPIVAGLRCGHSNISVSKEYEKYMRQNGKYLPFIVKVLDDRIYVYENLSSADIPAGSEILSINGKSAKDIIEILLENLTADAYNKTKKYYIMDHWFNGVFYNFVDNSDKFTLSFHKPGDEKELEATVSSNRNKQMDITAMSIYFYKGIPEETYFGEIEDDYALLTIKAFNGIKDKKRYKKYIYDFFQELASRKVENLILDFRGNWGGSPDVGAFLYSYLNSRSTPYLSEAPFYNYTYKWPVIPAKNVFKGNLYILINGGSFSTTGHLCSLLKHYNLGTLIGEESGGSAVVTAGGRNVVLKNTGLRLYCAGSVFKAAVGDMVGKTGLIPDYEVTYTIQDILEGRDLEMEKTIELINDNKK